MSLRFYPTPIVFKQFTRNEKRERVPKNHFAPHKNSEYRMSMIFHYYLLTFDTEWRALADKLINKIYYSPKSKPCGVDAA